MVPTPKNKRGRYAWVATKKNGKTLKHYTDDGEKIVYHGLNSAGQLETMDRANVKTWGFIKNDDNSPVAVMDVPDGAVVFQRRRVVDVNPSPGEFYTAEIEVPEAVVGNRYYPKRTVAKKYPKYTYGEVWLTGYRKREVDNSITVYFKAVYPDGKVESYNAFGVKGWLYEPEWFNEEQV